jgi:hypothetical protein
MATMSLSIDDEWDNFISCNLNEQHSGNKIKHNNYFDESEENDDIEESEIISDMNLLEVPKCSDIYISTKSKIAYLNKEIDLKNIFWKVPVIPYATPINGVIKKQMKFNSLNPEDLDIIQENLKKENYYEEQIITSINNPTGRIKFKDIRKVSIGVSKKDIMSYRCKKKSAFYNCFVMMMRIKIHDLFKEFHIKVFNTGKLEIPGIQNDLIFESVLENIIKTLQPYFEEPLAYLQKSDTVLINSNFNCGFYINREVLFDILKFKYNIQCIYDPCSYPGIQSKFYYHEGLEEQTGCPLINTTVSDNSNSSEKKTKEQKQQIKNETKINKGVEVSFMIFRTGSILIVGMCNETVLYTIYEFLKNLLTKEFYKINQKIITKNDKMLKDKKKKIRRKNIQITI